MKRPHLPSQQRKRPKFLTWIVVIPSCLCMGLIIGSYLNAFGEINDRQAKGLAHIATPNGEIIFAEVADTLDKRAQGLMYRTAMDENHGMLFIFPELGYWTFWMKNTKIPLDILWLDQKGTIIHIEANVPICTRVDDHCPRHYSYKQSWQVLELNAGTAEKFQLQPGSRLTISLPSQNLNPS
ncbi:DUF192 domain-containing protein [Nitrospira sp. MA-1]|nr:DUF192 domain-containing protein [Nitrospira sp. MA-1]